MGWHIESPRGLRYRFLVSSGIWGGGDAPSVARSRLFIVATSVTSPACLWWGWTALGRRWGRGLIYPNILETWWCPVRPDVVASLSPLGAFVCEVIPLALVVSSGHASVWVVSCSVYLSVVCLSRVVTRRPSTLVPVCWPWWTRGPVCEPPWECWIRLSPRPPHHRRPRNQGPLHLWSICDHHWVAGFEIAGPCLLLSGVLWGWTSLGEEAFLVSDSCPQPPTLTLLPCSRNRLSMYRLGSPSHAARYRRRLFVVWVATRALLSLPCELSPHQQSTLDLNSS